MFFAVLFHPYKLVSLHNVALYGCRKATRKGKKKTEEEKEDEAHARDIVKLQIKAYKHFYTPVEDGTYYGITRGWRAGGVHFFVRTISPKPL